MSDSRVLEKLRLWCEEDSSSAGTGTRPSRAEGEGEGSMSE